ncbi:CBM21 domain-containing protein [Oligoflexus tunisiensis]|uniref:CBM21 domain-containing protein n=1 Tax=Oligoflexus tunisiensis TaxID=708132 RepID=UPI001C407209|nr:CBM21 domain-containing protein [Oligoflexus tunisiensis]
MALILFSSSLPTFAAEEVRLAWAQSIQCPPISGCYRHERTFGIIEVKNLAFEKVVEVAYKTPWTGTEWITTKATYHAPANDGYEAWAFEAAGPVEAFAIAYSVAGTTYWDNNQGQNYQNKRYGIDLHLDEARPLAVTSAHMSGDDRIWIDLAVDGRYANGHPVQVQLEEGDQVLTLEAEYKETYPSGFQLWQAAVPVSEGLDVNGLLISAKAGQFLDTNYGLYYRIRR